MGRFPVTLYKEQWLRILASASEIEAFIRENDSKLIPIPECITGNRAWIALCGECHAKAQRTKVVLTALPPLLP